MSGHRRRDDCQFGTIPPSPWKTQMTRAIQAENRRLARRSARRAAIRRVLGHRYLRWTVCTLAVFCALFYLGWLVLSAFHNGFQLAMATGIQRSPIPLHLPDLFRTSP